MHAYMSYLNHESAYALLLLYSESSISLSESDPSSSPTCSTAPALGPLDIRAVDLMSMTDMLTPEV